MPFIHFNSIRSRMLTGFLFLTFLISLLAIVSFYLLDRTKRIAHIRQDVSHLQVLMLELIKADNDFFDFETISEAYFVDHTSSLLKRRDSLRIVSERVVTHIPLRKGSKEGEIEAQLKSLSNVLVAYNQKFSELEQLTYKRGFKDFGLEGQMRHHAHSLERYSSNISLIDLLTLRRHEKDFFLRKDTAYRYAFNQLASSIKRQLASSSTTSAVTARGHLEQYVFYFNELAAIDERLGLNSHLGLRMELNNLCTQLSTDYSRLSADAEELLTTVQFQARIFYSVIIVLIILFSLLMGIWFSKRLTLPVSKLSAAMKAASVSGVAYELPKEALLPHAASEVKMLAESFSQLMERTTNQMMLLKAKSRLVRKKNKSLKKLNRELDNFLYSAAHDIRSPLTSLLGIIGLMRYENKQPDLAQYLTMMENSIHRLEEFISQVVGYAKNKKLEIHADKVVLAKVVHEIFENHQFVEGSPQILKTVEISGEDFYSDKSRIMIVLTNLVSNAIRYADFTKEKPAIVIKGTITLQEAIITVSDNGQGIDSEYLHKIFEMFYKAHHHSKGSGLGLFIVKETLMKLKGTIEVSSLVGMGTVFTVRIPNMHFLKQSPAKVGIAQVVYN